MIQPNATSIGAAQNELHAELVGPVRIRNMRVMAHERLADAATDDVLVVSRPISLQVPHPVEHAPALCQVFHHDPIAIGSFPPYLPEQLGGLALK